MIDNSDRSIFLVFSFFVFVMIILGCLYYVFYELIFEVLLNNEVWYGASIGDVIFANNYLGGDPLRFQMLRVTIFSACLIVSYFLLHITFKHLRTVSTRRDSALKKVIPLVSAFLAILGWQIARIFQSKYVPLGLINYVVLGLLVGLSLAIIKNIPKHLR